MLPSQATGSHPKRPLGSLDYEDTRQKLPNAPYDFDLVLAWPVCKFGPGGPSQALL
jgi:hypothetical protein